MGLRFPARCRPTSAAAPPLRRKSGQGRMTLMFSATFPKEIQKLAQAFMRRASRREKVGARGSNKVGALVAGAGDGCSFRLVSMETNRETEAMMWTSMILCRRQKEPSLPELLDFKLLSLLERPFCWQPTSFDLSWPVSGSAKGNPAKCWVSMFQVCGRDRLLRTKRFGALDVDVGFPVPPVGVHFCWFRA